jgi:hypothetical protein
LVCVCSSRDLLVFFAFFTFPTFSPWILGQIARLGQTLDLRSHQFGIPPFSIKLSSFIRNILIASLVLTCSRFQVGIKTLAGQADRASARSVTPGDCPSDCIGARALPV